MRKLLLCLLALVLTVSVTIAQQPKIEKSTPFDEPDYGWNKLIQLKNGNTFFLHVAKKEGIEVMAFDKKRQLIGTNIIEGDLWNSKKLEITPIVGLYEINGEVVLFFVQVESFQTVLYRLRINAANGALIKEEEVGRLPRPVGMVQYSSTVGFDTKSIQVEKDPASDNYAVFYFNAHYSDVNQWLRIQQFDGSHKMINEAFYKGPDGIDKNTQFIGAAVRGNQVFLTAYFPESKKSGDGGKLVISKLTAGDPTYKHKILEHADDYKDASSIMVYNSNLNKIQLLTMSYLTSKSRFFSSVTKDYYLCLISYIDPESFEITSVKPVLAGKVGAYAHEHIDADYDFRGMPQQMVINKDNTVTLLMEESKTEVTTLNGRVTNIITYLGPLGISELSDTASEIAGYTINKRQVTNGDVPDLYLDERSKGIFQPARKSTTSENMKLRQYVSFDYVNAGSNRYVLFNDLIANYEKGEDQRKLKLMNKQSKTNTICYKLDNNSINKFFLFGDPENGEGTYCNIQASDYNKETGTYATLIVERDGRDKQARVAWVTFH